MDPAQFCTVCACSAVWRSFWAFLGYCAELITLFDTMLAADFDGCAALAGTGRCWYASTSTSRSTPATAPPSPTAPGASATSGSLPIPADPQGDTRYLAWTDVVNAAAWILVVIVLEVEVRLQLRGRLTDAVVDGTRYLKYVLYSTLFAAAVYWGFEGKFLDFWDASLWLFAFIFIELNVFDWQRETQAEERWMLPRKQ
jgi:hypothetical protein